MGGGAAAERRADAAQRDVVSDAGGAASERAVSSDVAAPWNPSGYSSAMNPVVSSPERKRWSTGQAGRYPWLRASARVSGPKQR